MEEAIQILTAQKIRELLTLCGIGDRSDEPIKQHILSISNFGEYSAAVGSRRTNQQQNSEDLIGHYHSQRDVAEWVTRGWMAVLERKGKGRSSQKDSDAASAGQTEQANNCAGVATDKSLVSGEPKVGSTAPAAHGEAYPTSNSSALPEVEAERHSALDSPSSATEDVPRPDHQKEPDCPSLAATHICSGSTFDVNGAGCITLLPSRLSSMPTLCASAMRTIEAILTNCVKLNYALTKYGRQRKIVTITTKIEDIRSYVDKITQLKYADAMYAVKKDNALFASKAMQARYNETAYWDIIFKGVKLLDPAKLPTSMGRLDDFARAKKHATRTFMEEAGYGTSYANQQRCRRLWRNMFEIFCHEYPKHTEPSLVETIQQWDNIYSPHIKQLEIRVNKENERDYGVKLWLSQSGNTWFSSAKEAAFQSSGPHKASPDELRAGGGGDGNKSIFITLLPKDKSFLSVCPIIPVQEGDILGVFAGMIRYSENFDAIYGVPGPGDKLWLDYSQVTGPLNLIRVTPPDGDANVSLRWELLEEAGKQESRMTWRVLVRALKRLSTTVSIHS
ncbi:hypothetical protein N7537_006315 [Penicillium hordei]|uniref:Uncharacterized protein n=1 Tax=Penicillium hordei TaxID=40994 RepID=A0AAD6E7B5_9EURO|nr:uncharacterized protein N7537_006315 [Penicillium hordei]KAJ5603359.1 hypothetical protein N7537_006315 [Penicillium hordei]